MSEYYDSNEEQDFSRRANRSRSRRNHEDEQEQKPKKKSRIPEPIRRFWRRYQLTKILLITVGLIVLTVGGYLFYLAKTANVSDLQAALKTTTVIYDKDGVEAGTLSVKRGLMWSWMPFLII